jgi:hypothetical protein
VIEAESKAVLHTIKEHDFQSAFKKWQKRWEVQKGTTFSAMVATRLKFNFWPENWRWLFLKHKGMLPHSDKIASIL